MLINFKSLTEEEYAFLMLLFDRKRNEIILIFKVYDMKC